MARKGGHVGEEDMHINPLDDSDSKPTKTVVPVKRGRGRPRKEENAFKNEGLLLNQGLHQVPAMSLESQKRSRRKGKQIVRSSDEEEGARFSPTHSTCKNAVSSESDNQNTTVSTNLDDQSMTEDPGLVQVVINGHAANLVTESDEPGDQCRTNPYKLVCIADNHQSKEEEGAYSPSNANKEDGSKSKQSGACQSSSSISLNLTLTCLLMDEEQADFDEIGSRSSEAFLSVNGYEVKAEMRPILRDIFTRHGDIAKDCTFRAVRSRASLLENVCEIYKKMEVANFMLITPSELNSLLEQVRDLETTKIELGWLHSRLVEIVEAKVGINTLKEEKRRTAEAIERRKQELVSDKKQLEVLSKKINENENTLIVLEAEEEKLHEKFNSMKSTLKVFHRKSLVYGLL